MGSAAEGRVKKRKLGLKYTVNIVQDDFVPDLYGFYLLFQDDSCRG